MASRTSYRVSVAHVRKSGYDKREERLNKCGKALSCKNNVLPMNLIVKNTGGQSGRIFDRDCLTDIRSAQGMLSSSGLLETIE